MSAPNHNGKDEEEPHPDLAMDAFRTFLKQHSEDKDYKITEIRPGVLQVSNVKSFCGVTWFGHNNGRIPKLRYYYTKTKKTLGAKLSNTREVQINIMFGAGFQIAEYEINMKDEHLQCLKAEYISFSALNNPLKEFLL